MYSILICWEVSLKLARCPTLKLFLYKIRSTKILWNFLHDTTASSQITQGMLTIKPMEFRLEVNWNGPVRCLEFVLNFSWWRQKSSTGNNNLGNFDPTDPTGQSGHFFYFFRTFSGWTEQAWSIKTENRFYHHAKLTNRQRQPVFSTNGKHPSSTKYFFLIPRIR